MFQIFHKKTLKNKFYVIIDLEKGMMMMEQNEIKTKIENVLNKVRPFLNHDGGDIEFLDFKDGIVYVRMIGACEGCALIEDTLQDGVATILKEEVPGVLEVVNVPVEEKK